MSCKRPSRRRWLGAVGLASVIILWHAVFVVYLIYYPYRPPWEW